MCPDAWLLNITNPMTCLTRAVCRETAVKTVGLCHEVGNWSHGSRHRPRPPGRGGAADGGRGQPFPGGHRPRLDGEDGFAILAEMVDEAGGLEALVPHPGQPEAEPFSQLDFVRRHVLSLTLPRHVGRAAAAGDRHIAEFVPWVAHRGVAIGARDCNIELTPIARREEHQDEYIADVDAWLAGTKELQTWAVGRAPGAGHRLAADRDPRESRSTSRTPDSARPPDGAVVESICVVDGDGIRGRDAAALPRARSPSWCAATRRSPS